jgi:hypothetical protein
MRPIAPTMSSVRSPALSLIREHSMSDEWKASYDRWKTRSPDDELYLYLPYSRAVDEEDMTEEQAEQQAVDQGELMAAAARVLISLVRGAERSEGGRSTHGELELNVELAAGGVETWTIRIERTASSH